MVHDRRMDRWKKWHIVVGASPKNKKAKDLQHSIESIKSDYQRKLKNKQRALRRKFQVNEKAPLKVKNPVKRSKGTVK